MSNAPTSLLFVSAVLASALVPRVAGACSPPSCVDGYFAPRANTNIPANAAALLVVNASSYVDAGASAAPSLKVANGELIAATLTAPAGRYAPALLVPTAPLPIGTLSFTHDTRCAGGEETSTFNVVPAVTKPTTIGTVTASPLLLQSLTVPTSSGSCVSPINAAAKRLTYAFSDEMKAFLPLAQFTLKIDDFVWANSDYGALDAASGGTSQPRSVTQLYRACASTDKGADQGLASLAVGLHRVTISAHIAGETVDPAPILLDLSIDNGCSMSLRQLDATGDAGPGEAIDQAGFDLTDDSPPSKGASSSGCSTSSGGGAAGVWGIALFGIAALALRARRRA